MRDLRKQAFLAISVVALGVSLYFGHRLYLRVIAYVVAATQQLQRQQESVDRQLQLQQQSFDRLNGTVADLQSSLQAVDLSVRQQTQILRTATSADIGHEHTNVRLFAIRSALSQMRGSPIIFIGDSITEGALLPAQLCERPVLNAGIGGASISSYLTNASEFLRLNAVQPLYVFALGTNDSFAGAGKLSTAEIDRLLAGIPMDRIIIAGLPPMDPSKTLAKSYFDLPLLEANNDILRTYAASRHIPFVNLMDALADVADATTDGVHLSGPAYAVWTKMMSDTVKRKLGCF